MAIDFLIATDPQRELRRRLTSLAFMELAGASSNRGFAQRLGHANCSRLEVLDQAGDSSLPPRSQPTPRRRSSRKIVVEILREESIPLRYVEVVVRARAIDEELKPSTIKSALCDLAASSCSPVNRVERGLYSVQRN
ncbi:MAG: hypothetical protein WAP35_00750 [Solirubrobacterales bacterium]